VGRIVTEEKEKEHTDKRNCTNYQDIPSSQETGIAPRTDSLRLIRNSPVFRLSFNNGGHFRSTVKADRAVIRRIAIAVRAIHGAS